MPEQQPDTIPTRNVIPPVTLVAIVCLTIGYVVGAKNTDHWEFKISDEAIKNYDVLKTNKRTGEVWAWEVTSKKWVEVKDGVGKD